jgi:hypothetical protein
MLCGGCTGLQYIAMIGRLFEQLTVAPLVKFPTFNYNLPLFTVFKNIYQFDVVVI